MTKLRTKGKPLSAETHLKLERIRAQQIGQMVLAGWYTLVAMDDPSPELNPPPESDMDAIVNAVLAVGQERRALLNRLRSALIAEQEEEALTLARELVNLRKEDGDGRHEAVH